MTDPKSGNSDPSMDDILASIRKIISDDEARAQAQQAGRPGAAPSARDDVLLLTELIEEPKSEVRPAAPSPRIDPTRAAEMPQPSFEEARPSDSPLVGGSTAASTASAFARLNRAVQGSVPLPAAEEPGPVVGNSGKTVADLVKEALRPILKEWLDRNLPQLVERYVEREIVRLTRR